MDINDLRSIITVVSLVTFVGIVGWTYSGRRKAAFDEAALLPFTDDEPVDPAWLEASAMGKKGETS